MNHIVEIASRISTPLALSGLIAAFVFLVFRQIIAKNIFPELTAALGGKIIIKIIDRLFVLALVAMVLGFFGYVLAIVANQHQPQSNSLRTGDRSGYDRTITRINDGYTKAVGPPPDAPTMIAAIYSLRSFREYSAETKLFLMNLKKDPRLHPEVFPEQVKSICIAADETLQALSTQ